MHKKCPYSEFFWSEFSLFWTKYRALWSKSVFSPNAGNCGPENYEYGYFSSSVDLGEIQLERLVGKQHSIQTLDRK